MNHIDADWDGVPNKPIDDYSMNAARANLCGGHFESTWHSSVTRLDLSHRGLGTQGVASLANRLKQNCCLESLDLQSNQIGDVGATCLAEALKSNTSLAWLNLCTNGITDNGASALIQALEQNTTLETLYLASNSRISDEKLRRIELLLEARERFQQTRRHPSRERLLYGHV